MSTSLGAFLCFCMLHSQQKSNPASNIMVFSNGETNFHEVGPNTKIHTLSNRAFAKHLYPIYLCSARSSTTTESRTSTPHFCTQMCQLTLGINVKHVVHIVTWTVDLSTSVTTSVTNLPPQTSKPSHTGGLHSIRSRRRSVRRTPLTEWLASGEAETAPRLIKVLEVTWGAAVAESLTGVSRRVSIRAKATSVSLSRDTATLNKLRVKPIHNCTYAEFHVAHTLHVRWLLQHEANCVSFVLSLGNSRALRRHHFLDGVQPPSCCAIDLCRAFRNEAAEPNAQPSTPALERARHRLETSAI